jgi:hypothetical protein
MLLLVLPKQRKRSEQIRFVFAFAKNTPPELGMQQPSDTLLLSLAFTLSA